MKCRDCGGELRVTDTDKLGDNSVRRYKRCMVCGARVRTREVEEEEFFKRVRVVRV